MPDVLSHRASRQREQAEHRRELAHISGPIVAELPRQISPVTTRLSTRGEQSEAAAGRREQTIRDTDDTKTDDDGPPVLLLRELAPVR